MCQGFEGGRMSGLREQYFGRLLTPPSPNIARFVESFEHGKDLWLVFQNEGVSLSSLLYTPDSTPREEVQTSPQGDTKYHNKNKNKNKNEYQVLAPSPWWVWLITSSEGQTASKALLCQLMMALATCHAHNITHRDIKPDNIIIDSRIPSPNITM